MPHERDETAHHRAQPAKRVMKNALADVEAGRVDTDTRGTDARAAFDGEPNLEQTAAPATDASGATTASPRKPRRRNAAS